MKHLVLLGAGFAHLELLRRLAPLARKGLLPYKVSLVAPQSSFFYPPMLAALLGGRREAQDCRIDLLPWLQAVGAQYLCARVLQLDAARQSLQLQGADSTFDLAYDTLSVATEPVLDRQQVQSSLPGAREHALFLRPTHAFVPLWEKLLLLAQERALRIALVGDDLAACEAAMAIRERLPHCAVTLVSGGLGPVGSYPEGVRQRVAQALRSRGVNVLPMRCTAVEAQQLVLDQTTRLACDAPIVALSAQAPPWLQGSALALDEQGFVRVNAMQQSVSHEQVFASADVATREDGTGMPRSWAQTRQSAASMVANVLAGLQQQPLRAQAANQPALSLMACGPRQALAIRGAWSSAGWWIRPWKGWVDQRFMARRQPMA